MREVEELVAYEEVRVKEVEGEGDCTIEGITIYTSL
jgi:hypothetical protein